MVNQRHLLSLLQKNFTTINVVFTSEPNAPQAPQPWRQAEDVVRAKGDDFSFVAGQRYTYKARLEANVCPGDTVVVMAPNGVLKCAFVVEVHASPRLDVNAAYDYKWIVQRVDTDSYVKQMQEEENFLEQMVEIERIRQRDELLKSFAASLPADSEARTKFEEATRKMLEG